MLITGSISIGTWVTFQQIAKDFPIKSVVLTENMGGNWIAATELTLYIHKNKIDTYASGDCFSSCAYMWLAGNNRYVTQEVVVGIHAPYGTFENQVMKVDNTDLAEGAWLIGAIGLPIEFSRFIAISVDNGNIIVNIPESIKVTWEDERIVDKYFTVISQEQFDNVKGK